MHAAQRRCVCGLLTSSIATNRPLSTVSAPNRRLGHSLQVLAHYQTDPLHGLSAAQVGEARRRHGRNELAPEPGELLGSLCPRRL
jgi:hypothetical protein